MVTREEEILKELGMMEERLGKWDIMNVVD
jgi:hypothetical protein